MSDKQIKDELRETLSDAQLQAVIDYPPKGFGPTKRRIAKELLVEGKQQEKENEAISNAESEQAASELAMEAIAVSKRQLNTSRMALGISAIALFLSVAAILKWFETASLTPP
ncbi:MAG: hypothetical protein V7727_18630 [Sneathiella sp.]